MAKEKAGAGTYGDGHPLDEVHYVECKLILRPESFTSAKSFRKGAEMLARAAAACDVDFDTDACSAEKPQIREVLFLDTPDFRLYGNAFILRRRLLYENGFPAGSPSVVFKFRHPDLKVAAGTDVRPSILEPHVVKFKAEALPLKERLGGIRVLYSHTVEFALGDATPWDPHTGMQQLVASLPALQALVRGDDELQLVNQVTVEEVLQDLGVLDFGKGITARANAAIWRSRHDEKPLVGEFSFQCKFHRGDDEHERIMRHCEKYFIRLQHEAGDLVSLTTTKTGVVYGLTGRAPASHE